MSKPNKLNVNVPYDGPKKKDQWVRTYDPITGCYHGAILIALTAGTTLSALVAFVWWLL